MAKQKETIAIIGAGASGVLLAANLAKGFKGEIYLVDRSGDYGRGFAYSTEDPQHLLNVPASKMSAFPNDPLHFFRWIKERTIVSEQTFVPRKIYGEYLHSLISREQFQWIPGNAIGIERISSSDSNQKYRIQIEGKDSIEAQKIVLALGNLPPEGANGIFESIRTDPRYIHQVWAPGTLVPIARTSRILIVGTGLTMVDIVVTLKAQGHQGKVICVSRRGLLPLAHQFSGGHYQLPPQLRNEPHSLRTWVRSVRAEIKKKKELDWRLVIDSLRDLTSQIWQNFSLEEKRRFLRHLRPFWDVHRHRVPTEIDDEMISLLRKGELEVLAARIASITSKEKSSRHRFP